MLDKYNNLSQKDIHKKKETNKIKIASLIPSKINKKDELKINIQENKNNTNYKEPRHVPNAKVILKAILFIKLFLTCKFWLFSEYF